MNDNVLDALAAALAPAMAKALGSKGATGTPTTYYTHGPGGLFSTAGLNQDVLASVVRPTGILEYLPAYGTTYMNPLYAYITGFQADTGDEPTGVCDNCKTAGLMKGCLQTAQFGRYCRETRELSVERLVQLTNRGEMSDLRLLNPVMGDINALSPGLTRKSILASEFQRALVEVGVSLERLLAGQVWTGNPANNNAGGYLEFPGLEILVSENKVDAISGVACPSLYSDLKDFAYGDVCEASNPSIVTTLTYMYRYLAKNARTMGFDPVDFRFVMREELFYELTSCWPCAYMSFRCATFDGANIDPVPQISAEAGIRLRDDMRNGRFLIVDGRQVPVILDDGIPEDTNVNNANLQPGEFSSDIYLLPFSVRGGSFSSLYLEYQDFSGALDDIALAGQSISYNVTDGGKFLWIPDKVRGCFLMQAIVKPRIVLLTPQLAGRLQNVKYEPLQHTRQPFPDDGYFKDGGATYRSESSYYSDWNDLRQ